MVAQFLTFHLMALAALGYRWTPRRTCFTILIRSSLLCV